MLCADKAYLDNALLTAVESVGGVPYIPFKSNSKPTGESDAWRCLWHMAKLLDVSLYDVLKGTALPANTCSHCGGALRNAEEP